MINGKKEARSVSWSEICSDVILNARRIQTVI